MPKRLEQPSTYSNELPRVISDKNKMVLSRFPEPENFIVYMNHQNCISRYADKGTTLAALKSNMIVLSDLKAIYSEKTPHHFIESWLLQLNIFVNTENKLSGDQIQELAIYMYDEIYMINMAELTLLFKRIKNGFYGPFYNRIDATQIVISCREYRKERSKHLIAIADEETKERDYKELERRIKSQQKEII